MNLNFHWSWRWWDRIQAIFLNLFHFMYILLVPNLRPEMWWPMSLWKSLRYYFDLQNPEPEGCCQYFWMGAWEAHCYPRPQTLCLPFPGSICDGAFSGHLDLNLIRLRLKEPRFFKSVPNISHENRKKASSVYGFNLRWRFFLGTWTYRIYFYQITYIFSSRILMWIFEYEIC